MERMLGIEELLNEAGWLRRLAASLVGDAARADDLVQDTWVAALRRPPAEGEPRPWLARVAHNLARNARRERVRREAREDFARVERDDPGPQALAQEAEAQRLLAEAVTRLPEPLRAVIVLRYFRGLDSSAAAASLGLPASTVRTRLQRALEELRADLDRRFEGGRRSWAALLAPLARGASAGAPPGAGPALAAASGGGAAVLGSWSLGALACAGAVAVLAALGATYRSLARAGSEPASPASPVQVASAASLAAQEPRPAAGGEREAVPARAQEEEPALAAVAAVPAADTPAAGAAEVSGTILVDGRPPEWPLEVVLEPMLPKSPEAQDQEKLLMKKRVKPLVQRLEPEQRGAFSFGELAPGWRGRVLVMDYSFADGEPAFPLAAPATGLVLRLASGPEIVGRIRGTDGQPIPDLEGSYQLRVGEPGEKPTDTWTRGFTCRADGRFRLPNLGQGEHGELTLLVEDAARGYLRLERPGLVPAQDLDLGELELEALRALAFTVRDTHGAPIEGAFARVAGPSWVKRAPLTGADGAGVLAAVPDRPVDVWFGAYAHAPRVVRAEPGSALEVELEPLAVLEVHLLGALAANAVHVVVSAERPAFVWDERGWDEGFEQLGLGGAKVARRRAPDAPGQRHEVELAVRPDGRFELPGVAPDVVLTLEARDADGRSLALGTIAAGSERRAVLELGDAGPAGEPAPAKVGRERAQLRSK